jgi:FeS assembly protein IscX
VTDRLDWNQPYEVAFRLAQTHPGLDPLTVRFTDLHAYVLALPGFVGAPTASNEGLLEAIQMAWLDEVED